MAWGTQHLLAETFPREDYRELLELTVYYLGGEVIRPRANGPPNIRFVMRQPGALDHSRFMENGYIYRRLPCLLMRCIPFQLLRTQAEHCVKAVQEFANAAWDGMYRGDIILVSSSHRMKIPTFSKNEMDENL